MTLLSDSAQPDDVRERLFLGGVLAIVRGKFSTKFLIDAATVLAEAGLSALEVTLNSENALEHILALRKHFRDDFVIGAGTVQSAADVDRAHAAEAQFLISPGFDHATVSRAAEKCLLHVPGVFTATEVQQAKNVGCQTLKLFPADGASPRYLKSLRAPFDDVAFIPTGGVDASNIAAWRAAGAMAVGAGSTLITGESQSLDDLRQRARAMMAAWRESER